MHLKSNRCSLKKLRKTLTEEFQILEGGLLNRVKAVLLSGGYSEAKLDTIGRKQWLEQVLEDDALQTQLEQLAEQWDELKADFDKKRLKLSVVKSLKVMI